ncbi:MAG TPA: CsgG/HfaB family protein [Thermoanaerobaculia bacterium]|jgi:curli biogenesis system outer membrane secretion channel CsgG|nr:CsgG/HfaB family protein [Thermoanaerobaculia bacterium]
MRFKTALAFLLIFVAGSVMAEKPVMAVNDFQNRTSAAWWYGGVGDDLAGMLTNELAGTGKFKMVERDKLSAVLDEQDLADSGRVSKKTGAKIGKLTGAQYLVTATLSAFEENTAGTGGGVSFRGISVGGKKESAYMAVDLRVIDTTTGEIEFTRTVEARASSGGLAVGVYRGGFGGNLGKYEKTPTGKAIRAVIMEISEYLSCAMVDKGDCMAEYQAKESSRREKTKKSIKLD